MKLINLYYFRQLLGNGTLYFPPFLAQDFRAEVHNARYRCRATSSVGTVLSREVTLRAGKYYVFLHKENSFFGDARTTQENLHSISFYKQI